VWDDIAPPRLRLLYFAATSAGRICAIVVLNRLVLESASAELTESVARRLAQFEASMQKVEQRAGKLLAREVSAAAACVRAILQNDIDAAGVKAAHLVYMVDRAHKRPVIIRWLAAGLVTAIGLLGLGFCVGMYLPVWSKNPSNVQHRVRSRNYWAATL
jgi:hypothetical protein